MLLTFSFFVLRYVFFICLHPVSCVTNVACFSGLSIFDSLIILTSCVLDLCFVELDRLIIFNFLCFKLVLCRT